MDFECDDNIIIDKALKVLNIDYISHRYFNHGTYSKVILLNDMYIIKQSNVPALKAEVEFLKLNNDKVFQQIIYIEPNYEFVIYNFIPGDVTKKVDDIPDYLNNIVSVTTNYKTYSSDYFGYLNEEVSSWSEFLKSEIDYSLKNLKIYENYSNIIDVNILYEYADKLDAYPFNKKLLHGDFGCHNFIKSNGKFVGIIDPMPVIGDYLYDLLYAIVSNVQVVSSITFEDIIKLVDEPKEKVFYLLLIVLYSRIYRCLKYNSSYIDVYIKFWNTLLEGDYI